MLEIGNTLREARMRRSLDIVDCESVTKIRGKYLRALEEEQFEMLPGPTYVRGFLLTYADHLGLDGRMVVEQYESQFERPREQTAHEEYLRRNRSERRSREGRLLAIIAAVVIAGAVAVWVTTGTVGTASTPEPPVEQTHEESVDLRFVTPTPGVELRVSKESASGPEIISPVVLVPNRPEELTVAAPVWVTLGGTGEVTVSINDRPTEIPEGARAFRVIGPGQIETTP